jgi:hypothetical protein
MTTLTQRATLLAVVAITGLLTLSPLSAQIRTTEFSVPFQFHAGNTALPAGEYRVSIDPGTRQSLITLAAADFGDALFLLPLPAAIREGAPQESTVALVFHKYGDDYFLRQVRQNGIRQTLNLPETRSEKAAARQGNLRQVALVHPR